MTPEQIDGITKARLKCNLGRVSTGDMFDTNDAYVAWVCDQAGLDSLPVEAADSYAEQWAGEAIESLEAQLAEAMQEKPA